MARFPLTVATLAANIVWFGAAFKVFARDGERFSRRHMLDPTNLQHRSTLSYVLKFLGGLNFALALLSAIRLWKTIMNRLSIGPSTLDKTVNSMAIALLATESNNSKIETSKKQQQRLEVIIKKVLMANGWPKGSTNWSLFFSDVCPNFDVFLVSIIAHASQGWFNVDSYLNSRIFKRPELLPFKFTREMTLYSLLID